MQSRNSTIICGESNSCRNELWATIRNNSSFRKGPFGVGLTKFNGELFTPQEIIAKVKEVLENA